MDAPVPSSSNAVVPFRSFEVQSEEGRVQEARPQLPEVVFCDSAPRKKLLLAEETEVLPTATSTVVVPRIEITIAEDCTRTERLQERTSGLFRTSRNGNSPEMVLLKTNTFHWDWLAIFLAVCALVVNIFSSIYWTEVLPAKVLSLLWYDSTNTIFTTSILSTATFVLLQKLFLTSCENLRWSLCAREEGINMLDFVALGNITYSGMCLLVGARRGQRIDSKLPLLEKLRKSPFRLFACLRSVHHPTGN